MVILVSHAVEHHRIRCLGGDFGGVHLRSRPAAMVRAEVDLGLDEDILLVHGRQARRIDDHYPVHARRDVRRHRHRRTVIHPDPGVGGREGVAVGGARRDGAHRLIRCKRAGMEVDRVPHRGVVDDGDVEGVAEMAAQGRTGSGPVVGPAALPNAWRDLEFRLGDGQRDPVRCRLGGGSEAGVGGAEVRSRRAVEIDRCGDGRCGDGRSRAGRVRARRPADDANREAHAHLAMADDRAPAVERPGQHAGVERLGGARAQASCLGAIGQHEVVAGLRIGIGHLDDEPIAGGHIDRVRVEAHVLGRHPHRGRMPARRDQRAGWRGAGHREAGRPRVGEHTAAHC